MRTRAVVDLHPASERARRRRHGRSATVPPLEPARPPVAHRACCRAALLAVLALRALGALGATPASAAPPARGFVKLIRPHFDHTPVITQTTFPTPQDVTRACLACHPSAVSIMQTSHWTWLGGEIELPGRPGKTRIGKKNLINNFCISAQGNERACMQCHAGYGWDGPDFDFGRAENVDCLVCHERTGAYLKGRAGLPKPGVDLVAAARSVATPSRESCLGCHAYGGGGQAVKHGDLDGSLVHPATDVDVHMGRHRFLCVDCHGGPDHRLRGRAFSVGVEDSNGVACTDCHQGREHRDARVEAHLARVACQTCHIPTYARRLPTKATWDWGQAGDPGRADDAHRYLRIKGEFTFEQDAVPEYRWFNLTVGRYLAGDRLDPQASTPLNPPRGSRSDPTARIWPFKIHRARQPYDVEHRYLLAPVTGGEGGYWTTFDWPSAFKLAEKSSGLPFSGKFGFTATEMYWPLNHMVTPKERALTCTDCHGPRGRMDWRALGYGADPLQARGRP